MSMGSTLPGYLQRAVNELLLGLTRAENAEQVPASLPRWHRHAVGPALHPAGHSRPVAGSGSWWQATRRTRF